VRARGETRSGRLLIMGGGEERSDEWKALTYEGRTLVALTVASLQPF